MPTGKAINITSTGNFQPPSIKKIKKIKKPQILSGFGVANKYAKLKLPPPVISGETQTPSGEVKQFALRSLKSALARLRAVKPTRIIKKGEEEPPSPYANYRTITETNKQKIQSLQVNQVPFRSKDADPLKRPSARILLNPEDLGFYGFNGTEWIPFKTPTFSLTTILSTGNNAGGKSIVNLNTINSNSVVANKMNVKHVSLDYWNVTSTLNLNGNDIYNVGTMSANTISATLYIGNYSSFERATNAISGNVLYTLIDKGSELDYQWNAHTDRMTKTAIKQGCADVNTLGEVLFASTYTTLPLILYDSTGQSTSITFVDFGYSTSTDAFVAKYNADGTIGWINRFIHTDEISTRGISTNFTGNILMTGGVNTGTLVINDVTGAVLSPIYYSTDDAYTMRFSPNGIYRWSVRASAASGKAIGYAISVNDSNAIVAAGTYQGTVTLYGTSGAPRVLSYNAALPSYTNCYLVKYLNSGVIEWATRFTANISDNSLDVKITNDGNIYVGGNSINNQISFYSVGNIISSIVIPNYGGGFLAKYTSGGVFQWATYILGGVSKSLRANSNNQIIVGGFYNGLLRMYSANTISPTTLSSNGPETFLVKYTGATGKVDWATHINNSPTDQTNFVRVNINNSNQIVVVGNYSSLGAEIYSTNTTIPVTLPASTKNTFIANYTPTGVYNWATRLGSDVEIQNYSANIQGSNEIFVTGTYGNTPLSIYSTTGTTLLTQIPSSTFGDDIHVIKYTPTMNSVLGTPSVDGQTKIIASSSPKVFITTPNKFNNQVGKTIVLTENKIVKLLWNASANNWIIQKNGGQLV